MTNSPENFVPYFKIRWTRKSAWTLEQGAYLSLGKDPDSKSHDISVSAENAVSKRYYWMLNKVKKGELNSVETVNGVDYFNLGSLFRSLEKNKFTIDKDVRKCLNYMSRSSPDTDIKQFVSRAVYREAGRLIFEKYPKAIIADVAIAIQNLPELFNNQKCGHIQKLHAHQIEPYLKNLSKLSQKPKSADIEILDIDLSQLVEKL